ncbi:MAG: TonB-dependent receptor, partial [Bacteroidia bacterium]|nr:TonB-dependent receptor [Bacteroidia bacterium]
MKNIIILVLAVITTQLAVAQITFSGQLKNAETSGPIESAYIRIKSPDKTYSTYSTSNGSFKIENVTKGNYSMAISHIGYNTLVEEIEITSAGSELIFLEPDMEFLDAAIITTIRAKNSTPTTFTNLDKKEIQVMDQSKDFPFLLNMTPSTVISSDAGNGIGYTGIRIRGIDPTRVNVTINGIPINDAESQGMYWVNMPDVASSTQSVQIQRGVGTSTNGAAAFGASVNIRTNDMPQDRTTT